MDWSKLDFGYVKTNGYISYHYSQGEWSKAQFVESETIPLHIASTALNYGQVAFEGLKAFRGIDGLLRVFRPQDNAKRMIRSANRILLESIPKNLFLEGIQQLVEKNKDFIPPYESGGSLYIRPLLIGSGEGLGITIPEEFTFILFANPVGSYYKGEGLKAVPSIILENCDRAAPHGLGSYKVAGNYAANMLALKEAKQKGFPINLYLDPKYNKYIDEFGTSNFIALKDNTYYTPLSDTILPSITNDSLATIAESIGMKVQKVPISYDQLHSFDQIAACGTAVVITPISKVVYKDETLYEKQEILDSLKKIYKIITDIQYGRQADDYSWCMIL